tara:strand:+ start:3379 stop:3525 length:147 start_codon:yes stop_codon:yes gene_type:complete
MDTAQAVIYYCEPMTKREFWATLDKKERQFFTDLNEKFQTQYEGAWKK